MPFLRPSSTGSSSHVDVGTCASELIACCLSNDNFDSISNIHLEMGESVFELDPVAEYLSKQNDFSLIIIIIVSQLACRPFFAHL